LTVGDLDADGNKNIFLLFGGKNYTRNVVETITIKNHKIQSEKTIFDQSYANTFGGFASLGEIFACDGSVFTFMNSSQSVASFFKLSP